MKIREFMKRLKATPGPWYLKSSGMIRLEGSRTLQCPLTSLVNLPSTSWTVAAGKLGMSLELAERIVLAADGDGIHGSADDKLRQQLLKATVNR